MNRKQRRTTQSQSGHTQKDDAAYHGQLALTLYSQGKRAEAAESYRRGIALKPDWTGAHVNLGRILSELGIFGEAGASINRALQIQPDFAEAHMAMGDVLRAEGKADEAIPYFERSVLLKPDLHRVYLILGDLFFAKGVMDRALANYDRALQFNPSLPEALAGKGNIFRSQRKFDEAAAQYERALVVMPDYVEACNNLGNVRDDKGDGAGAIECYLRVVELAPQRVEGFFNLGNALLRHSKSAEAEPYLRRCLELDPQDSLGVRMLLAKQGGAAVPDKASDAHMQKLYTQRADTWDHGTQSDHSYRGHELVVNALAKLSGKKPLNILDAGCGTGLVGPLVRPFAARLDGIDFSAAMLEKAKAKNVYDSLQLGDMVAFMQNAPETYDAITCAATLIHFGDLSPVFAAIAVALRKEGLFVATLFPDENDAGFSVAASEDFAQGGCYTHGRRYLAERAEQYGFVLETLDTEIHEYNRQGAPVQGLVMALRKH